MQQLNAVTIIGVPTGSVDATLKFLEDEAHKILPAGYVIDYTGGSRQLRIEGSNFVGVFLLAVILIFLVLAAQFNSFRDPFIILLGSVPLAMFGAGHLHVPEDAVRKIPDRRLDDFIQHLLAGRPGYACRPRFEKWNSDCAICE